MLLQNLVAQKELRAIQLEITSLSEKQKVLVAELKKEVEVKRMAGLTPQVATFRRYYLFYISKL